MLADYKNEALEIFLSVFKAELRSSPELPQSHTDQPRPE